MKDILLVTGGAGFIGSNFIKFLLNISDAKIINYDALTYAGNLENLKEIENDPRYDFVHGKIQDFSTVKEVCEKFDVTGIINFAAESHVDRSIINAQPFIDTNVTGTLSLLEVARELKIRRFLQVSTDEVYGSLGAEGLFTESTNIKPNSPYSASKASADHLVSAFYHTYGTPCLITRCSNNYGPYQFPEKLIPLMTLNALEDKKLPVYGDGLNVRDWIYVEDHCSAIWKVFQNGKPGDVFNVGGNCEKTNIDLVKIILKLLEKPESLITYVKDRPGHDLRYAIDSTKILNELGWEPEITFDQGIQKTLNWYKNNPEWCRSVRSGSYLKYYEDFYGKI